MPLDYVSNRGLVNNRSGAMAEEVVSRDYQRRGHVIKARRWRGCAGEIDIVVQSKDVIVFVEVKRARDFETAAMRLSQTQQKRIYNAGAEYLATQPKGLDTDVRFDVALVNAASEINVLENAIGF